MTSLQLLVLQGLHCSMKTIDEALSCETTRHCHVCAATAVPAGILNEYYAESGRGEHTCGEDMTCFQCPTRINSSSV